MAATGFGCLFSFVLVVGVEVGLRYTNPKLNFIEWQPHFSYDLSTLTKLLLGKTVLHNSISPTLKRRSSPATFGKKTKYAIFGGCSYTYGDDVLDNETTPYYFEKLNPEFRSYNLGIRGGGPHHVLSGVKKYDFAKNIKEKDGVFIYTLITDQIRRAAGKSNQCCSPFGDKYEVTNERRLVNTGSFRNQTIYRSIVAIIKNSYIYNYFNSFHVQKPSLKDFELSCALIKEIEREVKHQLPNTRFILALHPYERDLKEIKDCIRAANITTLDYTDLLNFKKKGPYSSWLIAGKHPNAPTNLRIAEQITKDLIPNNERSIASQIN